MTEDEAKAKWCPFGRIAHVNGATANSRAHNDPDLAQDCIGSACMAWRWHDNDLQRCRIPDGPDACSVDAPAHRPANVPTTWVWDATDAACGEACWTEPVEEWLARSHGFCGLAGVPPT